MCSVTCWSSLYHATDSQAMSLNYVFWLQFLQIDYVSLWNLVYQSPSWQYFEVYGLSALESNDGFIYWILPNGWVRFCYRVLEYIIINLLSLGYGSLFCPWLFGFWGRASYNISSLHQTHPRCTQRKWYKWREILIEINLLYAFPIDLCANRRYAYWVIPH